MQILYSRTNIRTGEANWNSRLWIHWHTCGTIDSLVGSQLIDDDPICHEIQALSPYCGCPRSPDACTLCPDGSTVPDEDKEMPWLSGIFGDDAGFVVTCGLVDAYLASLPSSDDTCKGLQYVSSYYGCPALPNHCRMCNGEDLKPEYAQKEFPLLTSKEAGITGTCKLFWAAQYQIPGGSVDCEVTTIFTHSCGCNDGLFPYMGTSNTTQQAALVWIPRVMGLISLVASVLVLHHIVRNKQKRKVYHHMMILIAAFDIVTSLVWMVGAVAVEKYFRDTDHPLGIYGAHGNSASCIASGFFFQLGKWWSNISTRFTSNVQSKQDLSEPKHHPTWYSTGNTSIFLNVSLTMYFYLIVVKNLREHQLKSIRFWLLGPPLIFGVGLSFAVIPFVQPSFTLCT